MWLCSRGSLFYSAINAEDGENKCDGFNLTINSFDVLGIHKSDPRMEILFVNLISEATFKLLNVLINNAMKV